jgi:hypothetical protein
MQVGPNCRHGAVGCSRAVVGIQGGLGIDRAVVDQRFALADQTASVPPRSQPDDLAQAAVLQDAGKHGITACPAGEVADDAARRNAVGRTQHEVDTTQNGSHTVGVFDDVKPKGLDLGVWAQVGQLPFEDVDLVLADVAGVAEVADEVVFEQSVGIEQNQPPNSVGGQRVGSSPSDAACADDKDRRSGEVGNGPISGQLLHALVGHVNVEVDGLYAVCSDIPRGNIWYVYLWVGSVDVSGHRQGQVAAPAGVEPSRVNPRSEAVNVQCVPCLTELPPDQV